MHQRKKFIFLLLLVTIIAGIFFYVTIKKAGRITITKYNTPLVSDETASIPVDDSDPMYGNPGAPVTLIEFADIGCKQCQKINYEIKNFVSKHPLDIRMVWKDAPRSNLFFNGYTLAHQAAQCAGKQNNFWQFLEIAMQNTNNLKEPGLKKIAEGLKLDTAKWWECTNSEEIKQKIGESLNLAEQLNVSDLPAIFINNRKIDLNSDIDMNQFLEQVIKKPEAEPSQTTENESL